jgi:AraC-like DNA-binding protein
VSDKLLDKKKIDPSDSRQVFTEISLRVHCCRYWMLEEWECINMSFPFWRLYYNSIGNARVAFNNTIHEISSDKIIIIPPNTPFAASLKGDFRNNNKESIVGKKILEISELDGLDKQKNADHLFIHFNLGLIADTLKPGIYVFENSPVRKAILSKIITDLLRDQSNIELITTFAIHALIMNLVGSMNPELWSYSTVDNRILATMHFIDNNIESKLENADLARLSNMANNSFSRLFHQQTRMTVREYIRKRRVEHACNLLHHSNEGIKTIATNCGFYDRHHFTRVFKELMSVSPGYYKKYHTIDEI